MNVTEQISAVSRTVGSRTLAAGEARVITVSRSYPTGIDDLWLAVTSPERIARWFLPVTGELKAGGHYELQGNAHGTVERCDPPHAYAATWEYGDEVSWIEVRLTPEGPDRTRFELEHVAHVDDERWGEYGPGAVGVGWDSGLLGLALHVDAPQAAVAADHGPEWMTSAEGRSFFTASSEAWGEASVAAGTPREEAAAAVAGTTAAYCPPLS